MSRARADPWAAIIFIVFVVIPIVAVGHYACEYDLGRCVEPSESTEPTPEVVDRNTSNGIVNLTVLPIDDGVRIKQTFTIRRGPSAPIGFEFPVNVEFQRVELNNWTEAHTYYVGRNVPFTVELVSGEVYRIVVEDSNGERRAMGLFVPRVPGNEETIIVGYGHVDDFGGGS